MAGGGKVNEVLQLDPRWPSLPWMSVDGAGVGGKPGDGISAWKAFIFTDWSFGRVLRSKQDLGGAGA